MTVEDLIEFRDNWAALAAQLYEEGNLLSAAKCLVKALTCQKEIDDFEFHAASWKEAA